MEYKNVLTKNLFTIRHYICAASSDIFFCNAIRSVAVSRVKLYFFIKIAKHHSGNINFQNRSVNCNSNTILFQK